MHGVKKNGYDVAMHGHAKVGRNGFSGHMNNENVRGNMERRTGTWSRS